MYTTPESFRTAVLDSQKLAFSFSQRMVDFQLGQMKLVEGQIKSQMDAGRSMFESAVELTKANQKAWLDSVTPAAKA